MFYNIFTKKYYLCSEFFMVLDFKVNKGFGCRETIIFFALKSTFVSGNESENDGRGNRCFPARTNHLLI
jgi:hypothetical protein